MIMRRAYWQSVVGSVGLKQVDIQVDIQGVKVNS